MYDFICSVKDIPSSNSRIVCVSLTLSDSAPVPEAFFCFALLESKASRFTIEKKSERVRKGERERESEKEIERQTDRARERICGIAGVFTI